MSHRYPKIDVITVQSASRKRHHVVEHFSWANQRKGEHHVILKPLQSEAIRAVTLSLAAVQATRYHLKFCAEIFCQIHSHRMDSPVSTEIVRNRRKRISTLPSPLQAKKPNIPEEFKAHLGRDKFVTHTKYNGADYLHLRVFENGLPTKKGIALCVTRTRALLDAIPVVDIEADTALTPSESEYSYHLGYGTFLRVLCYKGTRYYDVRRYWKPEGHQEPVPTKNGLYMNSDEFAQLKNCITDITKAIPDVLRVNACECWFLPNQLQTCARCFPFDFQNAWVPSLLRQRWARDICFL